MKTTKDLTFGEFGLEGKFYFKVFKQWIRLSIDEHSTAAYAKSCIEYANKISTATISKLFSISDVYRTDILTITGREVVKIRSRKALAKLIQPTSLIVPPPPRNLQPAAHFELECEWEPEHGMEWIVVEDRVKFVGSFEAYDPFGKFPKSDCCNYVNRV